MEPELDRPFAPEETEARVKETFTITVPPEEFAGRDGDGWLDFPFARYRYRDAELDSWVQSVGQILANPEKLRECQKKYLSSAERSLMLRLASDDNEAVDGD